MPGAGQFFIYGHIITEDGDILTLGSTLGIQYFLSKK